MCQAGACLALLGRGLTFRQDPFIGGMAYFLTPCLIFLHLGLLLKSCVVALLPRFPRPRLLWLRP